MAQSQSDFSTISIDRPIWCLGLEDASWLLPNIKRDKKVALFAFNNVFDSTAKEGTKKENDIGRITRAIPLYIAERLTLETNLNANLLVVCKNGIGPVLAGKRTAGKELATSLSTQNLDYIVTGIIEENKNQTIISIYLYETKSNKEELITQIKRNNTDISEVGAESVNDFFKNASIFQNYKAIETNNYNYSRPSAEMTSYYLKGIGQLLMQMLVVNNIISKDQLWGEDEMLNWYQTLLRNEPNNHCCKLLYFNGIVSSISYKGSAYKNHVEGFIKNNDFKDNSDPIVRLFPILYNKLNDRINLTKSIEKLSKAKSEDYKRWLNQFK